MCCGLQEALLLPKIMDVMGLCEGCSQMRVAFLVFSLGDGVQLQSSGVSCKPNGGHRHLA